MEVQDGSGIIGDLSLKAFRIMANGIRKFIKGARPLEDGELHFLGANFMGPGTKIEKAKYRNKKPLNRPDAVAKQHDLDYYEAINKKGISEKERKELIRKADNKMIRALKDMGELEGTEELYRQAGLKGIQFKRKVENVSPSLVKVLLPSDIVGKKKTKKEETKKEEPKKEEPKKEEEEEKEEPKKVEPKDIVPKSSKIPKEKQGPEYQKEQDGGGWRDELEGYKNDLRQWKLHPISRKDQIEAVQRGLANLRGRINRKLRYLINNDGDINFINNLQRLLVEIRQAVIDSYPRRIEGKNYDDRRMRGGLMKTRYKIPPYNQIHRGGKMSDLQNKILTVRKLKYNM